MSLTACSGFFYARYAALILSLIESQPIKVYSILVYSNSLLYYLTVCISSDSYGRCKVSLKPLPY